MEGFEAIYQTDSELLEGIFEGENTQSVFLNEMCGYNREQQEKIFDRLLTYMAGTEDVRFLIEKLAKLSMGPFANEKDSEIGSVWWKLFPKIKQICEYDEGCTDECIQVLMDNIQMGDVNPKLFDALGNLQRTFIDLVKTQTAYIENAELEYKKIAQEKEVSSDNVIERDSKNEVSTGGLKSSNQRELMQLIRNTVDSSNK
jgi:hypothetical protein